MPPNCSIHCTLNEGEHDRPYSIQMNLFRLDTKVSEQICAFGTPVLSFVNHSVMSIDWKTEKSVKYYCKLLIPGLEKVWNFETAAAKSGKNLISLLSGPLVTSIVDFKYSMFSSSLSAIFDFLRTAKFHKMGHGWLGKIQSLLTQNGYESWYQYQIQEVLRVFCLCSWTFSQ